ncbi:cytochrome B [Cereibacter changlensis JA139]|uniref:Cytochrome B n=2 Tax=Cereibacter changlensis TaxID=402884 RepID=A0A2T4JTT5_9RHOB|nr:cytochrome b/b6 domain-containing protein [Cereibacter changlensis]PTE21328.1 cytochrome B [Cereibacter changlensis JA139]PZX50421.1 cytochrome b561 [Cereibacter changlensis]
MRKARPAAFSPMQIRLHWIVAALVVFQFLFNAPMRWTWEAQQRGEDPGFSLLAWLHVAVGLVIGILVIWRIVLRFTHGAPGPISPLDTGEKSLAQFVATETQVFLLFALFVVPVSGAVAWFKGIPLAGALHADLKLLILALVGVHVLGALAHKFVLRDGLMERMRLPRD